jgi:CheY-like chemotaxis protein
MAIILLIGPDPETREVLKLRFEVDGHHVLAALGKEDALPIAKAKKPQIALIDMIDYIPGEIGETRSMTRELNKMGVSSVLLLPRGLLRVTKEVGRLRESCGSVSEGELPEANLIIRKPYDLNALAHEVYRIINIPKTSSTSRRDPRQRS